MRCAYCGKESKGTNEHIVSHGVLELFPECKLMYDKARWDERQKKEAAKQKDPAERAKILQEPMRGLQYEPMIKDVCADCNNNRIRYIDNAAIAFIEKYFVRNYEYDDRIAVDYHYASIQKMLLKYAFNDMRSCKCDTSFFDDDIKQYLRDQNMNVPLGHVSVFAGLAINCTPTPDAMLGNMKIRWQRNPCFRAQKVIQGIDPATGTVVRNENPNAFQFEDLQLSYIFRFNSVQFLLMCWKKGSNKINLNNRLVQYLYPYEMLTGDKTQAVLSICTDDLDYNYPEYVNVRGDGMTGIMGIDYGNSARNMLSFFWE